MFSQIVSHLICKIFSSFFNGWLFSFFFMECPYYKKLNNTPIYLSCITHYFSYLYPVCLPSKLNGSSLFSISSYVSRFIAFTHRSLNCILLEPVLWNKISNLYARFVQVKESFPYPLERRKLKLVCKGIHVECASPTASINLVIRGSGSGSKSWLRIKGHHSMFAGWGGRKFDKEKAVRGIIWWFRE